MKKICISKKWSFSSPDFKTVTEVDLPHDFLINQPRNPKSAGGGENGYFDGTTGRYKKYVPLGNDAHYILDIDGAYMCTRIYFNDELLGMHPHGYMPYLVDVSDHVYRGINNKIELTTENLQPSTRWYSGAGVYRDVFMWSGGSIRIEPWDMFVKTPDENTIEINTTITSDENKRAELAFEICDADGKTVCSEKKMISASKGKNNDITVISIKNAHLWDIDDPYLYTVKATITADGEVTDTFETAFGIRTIAVNAKEGFLLNGKSIKLRGGCIHHDHGALGAAEYPAAVHRKISRLKETGFNALRIAHNPPSLALLEECDRIGMLVMDEAFDMWNLPKTRFDYSLFFRDWWDRDISYMVLRDRNHPCVVSYSIGNEIAERGGSSDGYAWAKKLADEIRKYDATRPITSGVCEFWNGPDYDAPSDYEEYCKRDRVATCGDNMEYWNEKTDKFFEPLDIAGYNYLFQYYEDNSKKYPKRVIWGSETHALKFYDSWQEVMKHKNVIGDFTWTAYDNLGEAGTGRSAWAGEGFVPSISIAEYPWRNCYQGDLDLCGYRRPQSYFREAVWIGGIEPRIFTTHPKHFGEDFSGTEWHWYDVHESWTFEDEYIGKPVKAEVYTDADEILFILNGKELGKVKPEKAIASMAIPYEPGELTAVSFKKGKEQKRFTLCTTGTADRISVKAETDKMSAGNRDICFFEVEITDADGKLVTSAANELECTVYGGELMGFWSGCPNNEDEYGSGKCHAFEGRALVAVRSKNVGWVTVMVKADGLKCGSDSVKAK